MAKVIGFNPVDLGYGGMKNYSGSDNNKVLDDVKDGNYPIVGGDPYWADVTLLLQGSTTDVSNSNTTVTYTGTSLATAPTDGHHYDGISSIHDSSEGQKFVVSASAINFGSGNFTIEGWVRTTQSVATMSSGLAYHIDARGGQGFYNYVTAAGDGTFNTSLGSYPTNVSSQPWGRNAWNAWNHFAYSRTSGVLKIFVNGEEIASAADTSTWGGGPLTFAARFEGTYSSHIGYWNGIRITSGVGRYTANFTPAAVEFPTE